MRSLHINAVQAGGSQSLSLRDVDQGCVASGQPRQFRRQELDEKPRTCRHLAPEGVQG